MKILILGSTGMLGSMVWKYLSKQKGLNITAPTREMLDSVHYDEYDYIINCIGIIKQKLLNPKEAILTNSILPYMLKEGSSQAKIIQIATDCVFSGKRGHYTETDEHDALDIYGKTKSLGEVNASNFYNVRTSIVGFDKNKVSLLSWFLSQKKYAHIKGYTNHYWNGITTLEFAKLCYEIIIGNRIIPNFIHIVSKDIVSKYELLKIFAEKFNRKDIYIEKCRADTWVDRTLDTVYDKLPLTIEQMIEELAEYEK